jgi:hypothetical protein
MIGKIVARHLSIHYWCFLCNLPVLVREKLGQVVDCRQRVRMNSAEHLSAALLHFAIKPLCVIEAALVMIE